MKKKIGLAILVALVIALGIYAGLAIFSKPRITSTGFVSIALANPGAEDAFNWVLGEPAMVVGTSIDYDWSLGEPVVVLVYSAAVADIANIPASKAFGVVAINTSYWSKGAPPVWPLDDGECFFTVTNNSGGGQAVNIAIKATNFTGGVGWTLAGAPAGDQVTMKAGKSGDANEGAMVTLTTGNQAFIAALADTASKKWEIKLESSTSHSDGAVKTSIITLTATTP